MSLTDDDVLHVLAVPKRVTEKIEWKSRPGSTPKFECSFSVRIPTREDPEQAVLGKVEATHNRYKTKCAFIYAGVCIRRWESVGPHKNPDGQVIKGEHKHEWDEMHEDRRAYVPDDIDTADRDAILMSFLSECAIMIEGAGGYAPQMPGLGGDA